MADSSNNRVVVTDVDMSIWSMCRFMVKWTVAAIPAVIILLFIFAVFGGVLRGLLYR